MCHLSSGYSARHLLESKASFCWTPRFESRHSQAGPFFFVKKDKWRMADHDMIVEQDAADIGAKSYIWKYCADNSCHGQRGDSKNLQRKVCVDSVTGSLLKCPQPVLLPIPWSMLEGTEFSFIPELVYKNIHEKCSKRWVDLHAPLHGAGYCLESPGFRISQS